MPIIYLKISILGRIFIFFIPNKDKILYSYIKYQKLNDVIMKNRYILLNISKLQDRLLKVGNFIKYDLQGAYNLI